MKLPDGEIDPTARRALLVASDETYRQLTKEIDWQKILDLVGRSLFGGAFIGIWIVDQVLEAPRKQESSADAAAKLLGTAFVSSHYAGPSVLSSLSASNGAEPSDWWIKHKEIPLPHLAPVEAKRRFDYTVGHPIDGTVYGLLPSSETKYVPLALVDESEKRHRIAACKALLGALGAKKVEVMSTETRSVSGGGHAGVDVPGGPAVDASASAGRAQYANRRVLAEFGPPRRAPHVPKDHRIWLSSDPALAALVENRLENSLLRDSFTFEAGRSAHVNVEMCVGLTKLGLKVGGDYKAASAETWRCEATFWPWPAED